MVGLLSGLPQKIMISQCLCSPWNHEMIVMLKGQVVARNMSPSDLHGCFRLQSMSIHAVLLWHLGWKWKTMLPRSLKSVLYLQIDWTYAKWRFWSSLVTSDSRSCRAMHFNHVIISPAFSMPAQKLSYSSRSIPFVGGIWHGCLQAKQPGRNSAPWIQCVWAFASTALCSTMRPVCKVRLGVGEMFEVCSLSWVQFSSKKTWRQPIESNIHHLKDPSWF